jgi:ABC-type phosphate transport system substrate-binding protein
VPESGAPAERSRAVKEFLSWGLQEGQTIARGLGYATLPAALQSKAKSTVNSIH